MRGNLNRRLERLERLRPAVNQPWPVILDIPRAMTDQERRQAISQAQQAGYRVICSYEPADES